MDYKISEFQKYVSEIDQFHNKESDLMLKFVEEVGELAYEVRKTSMNGLTDERLYNVKLELYDCLHYVAAIANMYDIDLNESIELKDEINKKRYKR